MAHHQGMGLLSLAHLLLNQPMQKHFKANPLFQATSLLLQERIPKATARYFGIREISDVRMSTNMQDLPVRVLDRARTRRPRSEEHTSELQSLMRISYAVFCLKKKNNH